MQVDSQVKQRASDLDSTNTEMFGCADYSNHSMLNSMMTQQRTDRGRTNSKLIALTPHVLHEDGDVQSASPADNEGISCVTALHPEGQIAFQLTLQPFLQVATGHKLALLASKG